jgi:hypothetical protein
VNLDTNNVKGRGYLQVPGKYGILYEAINIYGQKKVNI